VKGGVQRPRWHAVARVLRPRLLAAALALVPAAGGVARGAEEYVIGGGDVLQVNVWKSTELTQTVTVRPDGYITLPLIRDVPAAGLSAVALGKAVAEKLSAFINAPNVTITVATAASYRVYTQGAIAAGVHVLQSPTNARQLLSRAGGATAEADLARAYVLRGDERIPVDLSPAGGDGAAAPNLLLAAGDVLVVPPREIALGRVLVVGEVVRPQPLPFQAGMTFLDALLGAGGGSPSADLRKARIVRQQPGGQPEELPVDLEAMLRGGALAANVTLRAGDVLIVPPRAAVELERILVVGEVRTPRTLPFREGLTVLEAYVEAGGGTEFADLSAVKLVRRGAGGKKEEIGVDLERVMKKADLTRNLTLGPGDIVVVPR
jgi:polysaccharide export outer membrane protein